jgi:hypothetical protein
LSRTSHSTSAPQTVRCHPTRADSCGWCTRSFGAPPSWRLLARSPSQASAPAAGDRRIQRSPRTLDCPLPHENQPHQTLANRDPRAVRRGRQVPHRMAGLRQKAPHTNMINRQGVACAPLGQATTMGRCRTPRSSHRRPDNKRTFRAPPSLNVRLHFLRDTDRRARREQLRRGR